MHITEYIAFVNSVCSSWRCTFKTPVNKKKTFALPKNFSHLNLTNLVSFESTFLADYSDTNFFRIYWVLLKLSHLITPCARHGGAPLNHLSTRKRLPLAKNFSLLSFTNLIPFESSSLADYHDINFLRIHCVLLNTSHSLTSFACNGGASLQHLSTTRKLLSL